MNLLSVSNAIALVRKNLEELDPNGSIMYFDENGSSADYGDNKSLDSIIRRSLPDAINAVNKVAPVGLLEGNTSLSPTNVSISLDGVLTFKLPANNCYLRLVAFQADDSLIVVTDTLPEASPEARKQLNRYIRGRADRPRLVLVHDTEGTPTFKYYSISNPSGYSGNPAGAIKQFSFVPEVFYVSDSTSNYPCAPRLRQNVVDYLTALVLETFNDQRSQTFYQKASSFPAV